MVTARIRKRLTGVRTFRPLLRFRLWFIPLVVVLLLATGWWMRAALEKSVKASLAESLEAILHANVTSLEIWLRDQRAYVSVLAGSDQVRVPVIRLERAWRERPDRRLVDLPPIAELADFLAPLCIQHDFEGFVVVAPDGTMIAAQDPALLGVRIRPERATILARALAGESVVSHPFFLDGPAGEQDAGSGSKMPIMVVGAPVRDDQGRVVAVLALRIDPDKDFTRILQSARLESTGETYAFDARGVMISHSRFDEQLREVGLLDASGGATSLLGVEIRDPGGDLTAGFRPPLARSAQPLTRMAASAVGGQSGVDVDGYRDYRGVEVAGAWTWLEDYDFGVAAEMDLDEALAMPAQLRRLFWTIIGLFVMIAGAIIGATMLVSRMGRQVSDALQRAQQLGQYTLEGKLGEGGMGQVYRARHAMLRRPTAIKLLEPRRANASDIARFEREVQLTSELTHPNTIAIYDYGRTPDGIFYYAMEYLPGIDLGKLIELDGAQPAGRVVHILLQACGSLGEAHAHGLIHRDIKPENIIVCERGGRHDVVKVLDFGIVKDASGTGETRLTSVGTFTGTPLYVAPEAWSTPEKVDSRADLYALGVVGYYLLSGKPPFEGESVVEIYEQHVGKLPVPPSQRSAIDPCPDLERVLLRCLEKDRDRRPQTTAELAEALAACDASGSWTEQQARAWWERHADDIVDRHRVETPRVATGRPATVVVDPHRRGAPTTISDRGPDGPQQ